MCDEGDSTGSVGDCEDTDEGCELWAKKGECSSDQIAKTTMANPRDGPAASFVPDEHAQALALWRQDPSKKPDDEFGLLLVSGWPPMPEMIKQYDRFVELVRQCFEPSDLQSAVYIYPSSCLHVTVATLHAFTRRSKGVDVREHLLRNWSNVVAKASRRVDWPASALQLTLKSSQIGKSAGILLWEETTGGLDRMRECIRLEAHDQRSKLEAAGIDLETLVIPSIVHSSFLRFRSVPQTSGEDIQSKFQELVVPQLENIFSSSLPLTSARFVNTSIPYMHIPCNDETVLQTFEFSS
jgi:hypothetical protein